MVFTQPELPELFQKILEKILQIIEDNGGKITAEEFKTIFYRSTKNSLRFTNDDINEMIQWLNNQEYINITRGNQYQRSELILRENH